MTVKPFEQSVIQHSSLFGPFLSYEENEVLQIQFFTTIYFFITMLSVVMLSIVMLNVVMLSVLRGAKLIDLKCIYLDAMLWGKVGGQFCNICDLPPKNHRFLRQF